MSEYLPQDVMIKILSRLPPKLLIRFRLVSKSWNSMISTPHFIKLHTQHTLLSNPNSHSPKTDQMIMRRYSKPLDIEVYSVHTDNEEFLVHDDIKIEYPFRDDIRFYYRIVGSCNGVFCLFDDQFGLARAVHLWNPVIRRRIKLPAPESSSPEDEESGACMIVLGFGFDAHSHDYKVVRLSFVQGDCEYALPPIVEVYALSKGSWHTVEGEIPNICVPDHFWSQAFINGSVHWVAYKLIGKKNKLENVILLFDVSLEVFDEMPLPEPIESELSLNLGALDFRGALAVVQYDERVWSTSCSIWVMNKYGDVSSWSKDHNITFGDAIGVVLGLRRNGNVLLSTRFGGLLSYDTGAERYKDLALFGTKDSFYVGPYHESLVLLAEGDLARERLPSDSEDDYGSDVDMACESSAEQDEDDGKIDDVEKCEYWMQCSMSQYLTALLRRPYI